MLTLARRAVDGNADLPLVRARTGDAAGFAELVRTHQAMVFSLALHFLGERTAAEDLAQEVFFDLYRHLDRLESAAHVTFWLRRVTSNRCIDRLRRRKHAVEHAVEELPEPAAPAASRDLLLEARVRHLVARLPARARLVVVLRYQEDLDPTEIAAVLRMPLNTVKSHLRRSITALRRQLETGPTV